MLLFRKKKVKKRCGGKIGEEEEVEVLTAATAGDATEKATSSFFFFQLPSMASPILCFSLSLSLSLPRGSPQRLSRRTRCLSPSAAETKGERARERGKEIKKSEELIADARKQEDIKISTSAPRQRYATSPGASCRAGHPAGRRGPRGGRATTCFWRERKEANAPFFFR